MVAYPPSQPAKLNTVGPQVWVADTPARLSDHKITPIDDLLPW